MTTTNASKLVTYAVLQSAVAASKLVNYAVLKPNAVISESGSATDAVSGSNPAANASKLVNYAVLKLTAVISESGAATDAVSVVATSALAESGAASDAVTAIVVGALSESGAAADTLSVKQASAVTESGAAADAVAASHAVLMLAPKTAIVWRSPTPGSKTTLIPGSVAANKGYELVVKTTLDNSDIHTVTPTSGTIGGQPSVSFTDERASLHTLSDADNHDWVIVCLCSGGYTTVNSVVEVRNPLNRSPTSYVTRGGALTGVADSSFGTISFWAFLGTGNLEAVFYIPGVFPPPPGIFNTQSVQLNLSQTGQVQLWLAGNDGATFSPGWAANYFYGSGLLGWHHYLISWDVNHASGSRIVQFYLDDVDQTPAQSIFADNGGPLTANYSAASDCWFAGLSPETSEGLNAALYDFWFDPGTFLDLSITANRRNFIDGSGNVVPLGTNGQTPTGSAPAVFFHKDPQDASPADFYSNLGTGGAFTLTGNPFLINAGGPPGF